MERRTATNDGQGTGKREQEGDVAPEQQNAHPNQRIETQQNQEAIGNGEPPQERSWCCGICPGRSFRWLFSKPKGTSQYFEKLNSELSSLQLEIESIEAELRKLPLQQKKFDQFSFWGLVLSVLLEAGFISFFRQRRRDNVFSEKWDDFWIGAAFCSIVPVSFMIMLGAIKICKYAKRQKETKLQESLPNLRELKTKKIKEAKEELSFTEFAMIAGRFDPEGQHSAMLLPDIQSQQKLKEAQEKNKKLQKLIEELLVLALEDHEGEDVQKAVRHSLRQFSKEEHEALKEEIPGFSKMLHQSFDDKIMKTLTTQKKKPQRRASVGEARPKPRNLDQEFSDATADNPRHSSFS